VEKNSETKLKKIKLSTVIYSVVILVILMVIGLAVFVYKFPDDNSALNKISRHIPFPAIIVNGTNFITISEINGNLASIKRFYENQDFSSLGYRVDFSTADGMKRLKIRKRELMNKMVEDRAIEILSKKRGIKINNKLVDESVDRKIKEYGERENSVVENLNELYGWSLKDFKNKIVKSGLYKDALTNWVDENVGQKKKKRSEKSIQEAKGKLDAGVSFEEVANKTSDGRATEKSGYLGWFKKEFLVEKLQETVPTMKKGEISGIIESKLGYHIVKLNDIKTKDGQEFYNLSQIFFPKVTFAEWLDSEIKKMDVKILLKDYVWNADSGMVEFKDAKMKEFEKKALSGPQRDVSLLTL